MKPLRYKGLWVSFSILKLVTCVANLNEGYSSLQYGSRLDSRMIESFGDVSFLDCVQECLVRTRCKSVNYFKGANYCETNYEDKASAGSQYMTKTGWVYSERVHWPQEFIEPCLQSSCAINEKCQLNKYSENTTFSCVPSDCGLPTREGIDYNNTGERSAIGLNRAMHVSCLPGWSQYGRGRLVCRSTGLWEYNIICAEGAWFQFGNHIYYMDRDMMDWTAAKNWCEDTKYASLATINSVEERDWIAQKLSEYIKKAYGALLILAIEDGVDGQIASVPKVITQSGDTSLPPEWNVYICERNLY